MASLSQALALPALVLTIERSLAVVVISWASLAHLSTSCRISQSSLRPWRRESLLGLRPCLRQSSSTINSWWRTWLSWSSCRPNLQHEFAAIKVLHKLFHVGWTDLRLASTTALTTSAATATRLFLSTTLHSLPPTWPKRLVQVQVPLTQALYLATSLLDRSSVHQQVRPLVLSLPRRLPT